MRRSSPVHGPAASSASAAAIRENPIRITGAASVPLIEARAEGRSHTGLVKPDDISAWLKQRGFPEKRLLPNTRWIYVSSIGGIKGLHSRSVSTSNVQTINTVGRSILHMLLFLRFFGDFFMWVLSFSCEAPSSQEQDQSKNYGHICGLCSSNEFIDFCNQFVDFDRFFHECVHRYVF